MKKLTLAITASFCINGLIAHPVQSVPGQKPDFLIAAKPQNTAQETLILYGGKKTRTPLVQWYLEEMKIPYKYREIDLSKDENHQAEFLAINPMGKLPAIKRGSFTLWESGAILLYLSDQYSQQSSSIETRAKINQWIIFANATLSPSLFVEDLRKKEMAKLLTTLNVILKKDSFLVGDQLTAADVAVVSYLYFAQKLLSLDYSPYPAIVAYVKTMSSRPAFQKTMGKR